MNTKIDYNTVSLQSTESKESIIRDLVQLAEKAGYSVVDVDDARPWGGFIRFETKDAPAFISQFFDDQNVPVEDGSGNLLPLSPKFLVVSPHQRLSWQRHERRSEIWRFLTDGGAYSKDIDPDNQPVYTTNSGEVVEIEQGYCHRLISKSDNYVLVAEVWRHADVNNLSAEEDNERLEDDYNR